MSANLTGCSILDIDGIARYDLSGDYTAPSLTKVCVDHWIPYFECHKCGRSDYCNFLNPILSIHPEC